MLLFQEATSATEQRRNSAPFSGLVPAVGLSPAFKWSMRFLLVLGRMLIAGAIMIEASGLIVFSPNELDMILNTLGATFILDIDNFAYSYFVTNFFKDQIRAIPPIGVSGGLGGTMADFFWQMFGAYLFIPTLLGSAAALQAGWCDSGGTLVAWLALGIPILCCTGCFSFFASKGANEEAYEFRSYEVKDTGDVELGQVKVEVGGAPEGFEAQLAAMESKLKAELKAELMAEFRELAVRPAVTTAEEGHL